MALSKSNILIVDDTPDNLRLLARILADAGYMVRPSRSGKLALASVQSVLPDLILLDIMMPEMDGYEVCRRLKADELTRDIPVIFISALNNIDEKIKSFAVGAVDYIAKPFHGDEVLARVKTHLTIRQLQNDLLTQIAELDAFGHTVAHDLKNPLALIVGFAELMLSDNLRLTASQQGNYLRQIQKAGYKAANIIDELLLLASVRRQDVQMVPIDMALVVAQAQDRLFTLIDEYGAKIHLPDNWPTAVGHAAWVEEIWVNYLSNGLKYGGRPPCIELGAERTAVNQIRFWVKDNGPGIAAHKQTTLFTEFTRLNEIKVEGHGLGLSIVQRIVNKLSGQVGVISQEGAGSEFYFTLPAANSTDLSEP
ncbi:MAG: response regulator [Chloroflexi bacterium]|nr:response regulator [Chloroflexota bacterium]